MPTTDPLGSSAPANAPHNDGELSDDDLEGVIGGGPTGPLSAPARTTTADEDPTPAPLL